MTIGTRKIVLPPCPACDVRGTEGWLSSMAEDGWFLEDDGFFAGLAFFRRGAPEPGARYRLDALPPQGLLDDGILIPEDKALLCESLGWKYAAKRSFFAVWRCTGGPDAPELHTDAKLEALSMRALYRDRILNMAVTCILLFLFFYVLAVGGTLSGALFGKGMVFLLSEILLILYMTALDVREMIYLTRLYRQLSGGVRQEREPEQKEAALPQNPAWKKRAVGNKIVFFAGLVLLLACVTAFFAGFAHKRDGMTALSGSAVPDPALPFPAAAALFPDGTLTYDEVFYADSYVRRTKDLLAPQVIETEEYFTVREGDETVFSGFIHVQFCETSFPFLARRIADEWLTGAEKQSHYNGTEELPAADGVRIWKYTELFPTLLFTCDRYTVRVTYCAFDNTPFLEDIIKGMFADAIEGS